MPRLRQAVRSARGVLPVELVSADDAAWISVASALEWFEVHGLEVDLAVLEVGPAHRHRAAVLAWASAHDWVRPQGFGGGRLVPDLKRLGEAGVELNAAILIVESLSAANVTTL